MKLFMSLLALSLMASSAYAQNYFQTQGNSREVVGTDNIINMCNYCSHHYFLYNVDHKYRYKVLYDNTVTCNKDYDALVLKMQNDEYSKCLKHGGGTACALRK